MAEGQKDDSEDVIDSSPETPEYEFQIPESGLVFTGERYTPDVKDKIQHEHFHRYLTALQFCAGKDVVDLGCGEGYGAALIGTVAKSVTGIDSSSETIAHAREAYGGSSVRFIAEDATATSLPDNSTDVVVSFETLEHLDDHEGFITEVLRVLRRDGLLVLSTPDRSQYLAGSTPNPYHVREVDAVELRTLLERGFSAVLIGGQRSDPASLITFPAGANLRSPTYFERLTTGRFEQGSDLFAPVYLIALATRGELPEVSPNVLLDAAYLPRLHEDYHRALTEVWAEVGSRDRQLTELVEAARTSVIAYDQKIEHAHARIERSAQRLKRAQAAIAEREQELALRRAELATVRAEPIAAAAELTVARAELVVARSELAAAYGSLSWRLTAPLRAGRQITRRAPRRPFNALKHRVALIRASEPYGRLRVSRPGVALRRLLGRVDSPVGIPDASEARTIAFADDHALDPAIRDSAIVDRVRSSIGRAGSVRAAERLGFKPLVSILMPVFETPVDLAREAVASVVSQSYTNWELIIVDDGSRSPEIHAYLDELIVVDDRVRITRHGENRGISHATNSALSLAAGEFVAMLDHDDRMYPDALLEVVRVLDADPATDAVYTDQEYIEANGSLGEPLLKPDWAPIFFRGVMYIGHLLVVRRSLALLVGGFDSRFDNVQDFEFMLRVGEQTRRIAHVPSVLYGWRRAPGSVASSGDAKRDINELQANAVTAQLQRLGIPAVARPDPRFAHRAEVIPQTSPAPATVLVFGEDPTSAATTMDELAGAASDTIRAIEYIPGTNAVEVVSKHSFEGGEMLVLIESGLVPHGGDWLSELGFYASLAGVAFASGVIVRDDVVEEAGLLLGVDGDPTPALSGWSVNTDGYAGSLSCAREVSAVSAGCAAISAATLDTLGGFDPLFADIHGAVISLSLQASRAGLRNVVVPRASFRRVAVPLHRLHPLDRLLLRDRADSSDPPRDPFHNPAFIQSDGGYRVMDRS